MPGYGYGKTSKKMNKKPTMKKKVRIVMGNKNKKAKKKTKGNTDPTNPRKCKTFSF